MWVPCRRGRQAANDDRAGRGVPELADAALAELHSKETEQSLFEYQAPGGWGFQYDRRWHMMLDKPDSLALRLIERGDLLAQCNVSQLAQGRAWQTRQPDRFQEDVQKAPGQRLQAVRACFGGP